jgi:DNA-binding MarR family transcriptional regulator
MTNEEILYETIDRFWDTFPRVWGRIRTNVRTNAIIGFDISPVQFHLLRHIHSGAHSIGELAERQQISRPATSQAVDILVAKGLVTREQATDDRRYVQLTMTERGNDLLNSVFTKNRQWMAEKMTGLSQNELETIIEGLNYLKNAFEKDKD